MTTMTTRSTSWTTMALAVAVSALPLGAQDDPAKEPDPAVAEKLETFDSAVGDRHFERDAEAVGIIDELLKGYEGMHPKDQKDFVKALDGVFKARRRDPDQQQLYVATAVALGSVGGDRCSRILVAVYDRKPFSDDEWLSFQEVLLENIGRTKDERQVDFLLKRAAQDPEDRIKASAGKALRFFEDSSFKVREDIVKKLLRDYGKIEGDTQTSQVNDALAATRKRTLRAIADPWNTTLQKLTGQEFRTAEEWQAWYNKNKGKAKNWGGTSGS